MQVQVQAIAAMPISPLRWFLKSLYWLLDMQQRYDDRLHLAALDDAALQDVGLNRDDLRHALQKPFWRL